MQCFIPKYVARRQSTLSFMFASLRSFSAVADTVEKDNYESQVLVQGMSKARASILNRPSSLNALTTAMGARLTRLYESWEDNPDIGFVAMKGSGRAFCAGGDVAALFCLLNEGKEEECKNFFRTLYRFIYLLGTYLKPHVAILDGITMGGGAGVSIPGTFRVTTDRTVFATPETQIGFHPDAGASFYLSHLPGYLGEYLALTGEKLDGPDMIACGLATHFCLNARLDMLDDRLSKLITDDPSVLESDLDTYCDLVYPDQKSVVRRMEIIDKCFSHDTVEEIIDALENEAAKSYDAKIDSALKKLKKASPLSLKVSLKSIRDGRFQSLDQCLVREYRMSLHGISKKISSDFCEGVRAQLIDKDYTPKWDPPTLDHVPKDMVESYFAPLGVFEPELELPIEQREPFL